MDKVIVKIRGKRTTVSVNGVELHGLRGIRFEHDAGKTPTMTIEVATLDVTFDTDFIPALPEPLSHFYKPISE